MRAATILLSVGALAGMLLLVVLVVETLQSQDRARESAVSRLDVRSRISAQLLSGTIALNTSETATTAAESLSMPNPTNDDLRAWMRDEDVEAAQVVLLSATGSVVASVPEGAPPPAIKDDVLAEALQGQPTTSRELGDGADSTIAILAPYDAGPVGRRVVVTVIATPLLRAFLGGTLADATGTSSGGALILDRDGLPIVAIGDEALDEQLQQDLSDSLGRGRSSGVVGDIRFAVSDVAGTSWRLTLVAPEAELTADLPSTLLPRLALAAFAVTLLGVVVFAMRSILASRRLLEAREAAERANDAKSRFLTHISHELKQPLAAIMGFSDILLQRPDMGDADRRHFLGIVARSGRNLEQLVNELLDISRIESGRVLLNLEEVDPRLAIEDAFSLHEALAADRRVTLELDDRRIARQGIVADPMRLRQILLNLVSNAIKYNREHGRVRVSVSDTDRGMVHIAVTDEGDGISDEDISRLFRPFERLQEERGHVDGTGLGLVITKALVDAMGGNLVVHSEVGVGSTFAFDLPVGTTSIPAGKGTGHGADARLADESLEGRVLHIEDDPANLELVGRILERERPGLEFETATEGEEGVRMAERHPPDVLLLDLNLPDISGEQVLRRIRSDVDTADVPVIVVSSDSSSSSVTRLLQTGADAYVTKPIDVERLLGTVDVLVRRRAAVGGADGAGGAGDDGDDGDEDDLPEATVPAASP